MNPDNPFELNEFDTTAAFIDGPSLYWAYRQLGHESQMDFLKLRDFIADNSRNQSLSYYTVLPPAHRRDANGHTPIKPLADMLGFNGFRVHMKEAYSVQTDLGMRTKGSINLDLGLDAYDAAHRGINHVMMFVNDDDFLPVISRIKDLQTRVTLVSTEVRNVAPSDLIWSADNFIDLDDIKHLLARKRQDDE